MNHNRTLLDEEWQNDWNAFVDVLADQLCRGSSQEQLAARFGSKVVVWSGILVEKLLDEIAPIVTMTMPTAEIDLGQLGVLDLHDQSVPCARDSVSIWNTIPIGTLISFTATFRSVDAIFPPVGVNHLSSGRVVVLIGLADGRPLCE